MFESIWQNKEWLFSGIGVFILGSVITFIVWLRKKNAIKEVSKLNVQLPTRTTPIIEANLSNGPSKNNLLPITNSIAPRQIYGQINSAALLLQDEVRKQFLGIPVKWSGSLTNILSKEYAKPNISVYIYVENRHLVTFFVNPVNYPGIGTLKDGHIIEVEGTISKIDQISIGLVDAKIKFEI
jgi:hypothetical protein